MLIADRYRLERPLGEGGSGVVWAATHTMMQRQAALKFLKTGRADAVKRFFREARVSAALHHPNIVEVHDVFMMPGTETPVMVMDLLKGESLGARLRRVGKLSAAEAARLLLPVVLALGAAHALGVVHRDLKPENIFLEGAETGDGLLVTREVRVLDFGLAKLTASEGSMATTSRLTRSGVVLGTPQYLAPEQVTASENVDQNVDVWALGVVLYECVAGRRPFVGPGLPRLFREISNETPTPLVDMTQDVPPSLSAIVARMLDKTPAARPHLALVHEVLATCASF
jgi:serine/threonine-protein kinase